VRRAQAARCSDLRGEVVRDGEMSEMATVELEAPWMPFLARASARVDVPE
jgi:hypothetical protein